MDVKGKKISVIGLGKRTGVAAARMLADSGAVVTVSDTKGPQQLEEEMALLAGYDLDYDLNGHGEKSLDSDLIVVSPGVPLDIPFFRQAAEKGVPVISEIELAYNFTRAGIIAITGTNGKTTTTKLLGDILRNSGISRVEVAGNIGIPLISVIDGLTEKDWVVVEVSSFQLETVKNFRPRLSIFLNFSPDHLDRHKSIDNYWQAKKRIFENQTGEDMALINVDQEVVRRAAADSQAAIYGVSMEKAIEKGAYLQNNNIFVKLPDRKEEKILSTADIPLRGRHNFQNVTFSVLAARLLGVGIGVIRESVKKFAPEEHRLQYIGETEQGILVIDDSKATNPDAAIQAIRSFSCPLVLIAGGQDRQADFDLLAEVIADRVKALVLMGESRDKIADIVLNKGFRNIYKVENMKEAVQTASKQLVGGDCLLLAPGCPSWDMYSSYKVRGQEFVTETKKALF